MPELPDSGQTGPDGHRAGAGAERLHVIASESASKVAFSSWDDVRQAQYRSLPVDSKQANPPETIAICSEDNSEPVDRAGTIDAGAKVDVPSDGKANSERL